jgi:hypothetical protein
LNAINLKKIKVLETEGKCLVQITFITLPSTENAIQLIEKTTGALITKIIFYLPKVYTYNVESQTNNLYDSKSYYITTSGGDGKRIKETKPTSSTATLSVTTFDDHQFHETI